MNDTQASNLFLLVRHANVMVRQLFMNDFVTACGTPLCMMGEAAGMAYFNERGLTITGPHLRFKGMLLNSDAYQELFGLTLDEQCGLFGNEKGNYWLSNHPDPKQWAEAALRVLAENGYTSDPAMAKAPSYCTTPNNCVHPYCVCDCPAVQATRTLCTQLVAAAAGMDEEEKLELIGEEQC